MERRILAGLFVAGALALMSCQTVKTIAKNWDSLSEFRLPQDQALAEQGRIFRNGDDYTLGSVTSHRRIEKLEPDFWTAFFHALSDDSKSNGHDQSKDARYRVTDTIAIDGSPKYELTTMYSIAINKDGTDSSQGISSLTLRSLPGRKRLDFQRTAQIGLERFIQAELPNTKVKYYFNDLDRTGGWADVLRLPTGIAIKNSTGYRAIVDLRYEHHYYLADPSDASESNLVALLLAALVWDSDEVKKEFAEQTRGL